LVRGDIRALPFAADHFAMVLAPYGVLQSLLRDRDLTDTIASVARVLRPGGTFGIDLVPDVPHWREDRRRGPLPGRAPGGARHVARRGRACSPAGRNGLRSFPAGN